MQKILQSQNKDVIRRYYPSRKQLKIKKQKVVFDWKSGAKAYENIWKSVTSSEKRTWLDYIERFAGSLFTITGDLPLLFAMVSLLLFSILLPFDYYEDYILSMQTIERVDDFQNLYESEYITVVHKVNESDEAFLSNMVLNDVGDSSLTEFLNTDYDGKGGISDASIRSFMPLRTVSHVVQNGDTLSKIAGSYGLRLDTLVSYNNIQNARRMQLGEYILIPDRDGILYRVESNDSLNEIASTYDVPVTTILDANNLKTNELNSGAVLFIPEATMGDKELRLALGELFRLPTYGRISSHFGYRNDPFTGIRAFHYGVDIANSLNTPIVAANSGYVAFVGSNERSYGKYVIIKHDNEFQTLYAHFNDITVSRGEYVQIGQTLGYMGSSGRSTGPHLHFSIIRRGTFVNPSDYIF